MLVDEGDTSMEEKIVVVLNEMSEYLPITQMILILKAGSVLSMVKEIRNGGFILMQRQKYI